jgi:hypothetical protein
LSSFYFRYIEAKRSMGRNVPGKLKILRILITPVIAICLLAGGLMAEACVCGDTCLHGLQLSEKPWKSDLIHFRCSKASCKNCTLEDGKSYKAYGGHRTSSHNKTNPESLFKINAGEIYKICNYLAASFPRVFIPIEFSPLPMYLTHLSLRL